MPDLRNGFLEGEQCLEELQVPPSLCTSLKNSSLLCPLGCCSQAPCVGTALGHSELQLLGWVGSLERVDWGKLPLFLHFSVFQGVAVFFPPSQ